MRKSDNASTEKNRWNNEQEIESFKSSLQRLLLRICLSAEGQNSELDTLLDNIRTEIKSQNLDADRLAEILKEADQVLVVFDETKEEYYASFSKVIGEMADQLSMLKPEKNERAALKKLVKSAEHKGLSYDRFVPVLRQYSGIQAKIFPGLLEDKPKGGGLFERLFGQDSNDAKAPEAQNAPVELDSNDPLEIDTAQPAGDEIVPGFSAISEHIRATLNSLLDQLTFPDSAKKAVERLRSQVDKTLNWYELGPTLDDLSSLVISVVGRGQRDFGSFLSDIDERLQKIQSFVLEAFKVDENLREEERKLDMEVRAQISSMTESLDSDQDVETLKQSIRSQVESISSVLDKLSETGQKLERNKSNELEELKSRFQMLEEETRFFRQRLKEERSKALTDALTQLPNREAYDERMNLEWERWKRYQKPITLIVADVDHFKSINDTYGHLSGDKVLQILAKEMHSRMRATDFIARYGGEEFVMILPETDLKAATGVIEKMRETIERLPFHFRDKQVQVTLSFGMVPFTEGLEPMEIFERADQALYQAKRSGRNRLQVWKPGDK